MELEQALPAPRTGGLSANTLKWIAIAAMIIDHIADGFLPYGTWPYTLMRLVGRITGPTMFYFVAVGYRHTRNVNRYTLRLAVFALISYVPYIYFHDGTLPNSQNWMDMSVIFTLLLGLLAIRVQHEVKHLAARIPLLLALFLLAAFGDWNYLGFTIMLAFDYFYGNKEHQAFAYLLVITMGGGFLMTFLYPVVMVSVGAEIVWSSYPGMLTSLGMVLPILLLLRYNGKKGAGGSWAKWSFYLIYPLHLLLLGLIKAIVSM